MRGPLSSSPSPRRSTLKRENNSLDALELRDPPVQVALRRSRGARRMSLSVSRIDGGARLTIPHRCSRKAARAFLEEHRDWLRATLAKTPAERRIAIGSELPYRGRVLTLRHAPKTRLLRLDAENTLWVGGPPDQAGRRAVAWLKEEARATLLSRSRKYAEQLGTRFERVSIRDTRSRWGSCSSAGALSYSWRLIMAPESVLDYVAAHEASHLLEMNHSDRFWAHVERLRPDWREQRDWLRAHGADLHLYRA